MKKFGKLSLTKVVKGGKVSGDVRPELKANVGSNNFTINASAAKIMELKSEDYVSVFVNGEAEDLESQFFIAKSSAEAGGSVVKSNGKKEFNALSLTVSQVWSQMMQQDPKAEPKTMAQLIDMGLASKRYSQTNKNGEDVYTNLALQAVGYELSSESFEQEIDGTTFTIFPLVSPRVYKAEIKEAKDSKIEAKGEAEEDVAKDAVAEDVADDMI